MGLPRPHAPAGGPRLPPARPGGGPRGAPLSPGPGALDYVVVGAGSAGCVLAARLSEDPGTRVLLLEAGPADTRREIAVPAAFSRLFKTEVDWGYTTEPQPRLAGRTLYWPRGKVLGGSSSINAMIWIRGHPADFDGWAARGNDGWGWAAVRPYFERAERRLSIEPLRSPNPVSRAFVEAGVACGLARNDDFNGAGQEGVGFYRVTQRRGRRESAATAYLRPARGRPNLTVLTGAHATRVLLERGRAVGVAWVREGRAAEAHAGREVILCGGAINSPQLLMLSGLGPAAHLEALGIPVLADLPAVGENLHDHLATGIAWACTRPVSLLNAERPGSLLRYLVLRRGPLTSNVAEAGAFVRSSPALAAPDLQFLFGPAYFVDHGFGDPEGHGFTIGPTLLQPASRGRVRLRSRDPLAPPAIDPGYLADEADVRTLLAGLRLARRLGEAAPLDRFRGPEALPGADSVGDDALRAHLAARAQTLYHPVGTCRMGRDGVVDARLRVRGVEGLRVVDASVMPVIPRGNTNAPTLMLAERAADLVRGLTPPGSTS